MEPEMVFPWTAMERAGLWGTGVLLRRSEIAFLKHVVESYEGLGFTRMVGAEGSGDEATVAVIATKDFIFELDRLLCSLRDTVGYRLEAVALPEVCRERWFHTEWSEPESS